MIDIFEDIETAITVQTLNVPTMEGLGIEPMTPSSPEMILKRRRQMESSKSPMLKKRGHHDSESCSKISEKSESASQIFQGKNPIKISWSDLKYTVQPRGKNPQGQPKQILKGVTGFAIPGETCFIMGASGAGKTTLLNILSQRTKCLNSGKIEGAVTVNDSIDLTMDLFGKFGAYVMQDDILYAFFTPRESLTFSARMRLNKPIKEQDARVEELLKDLGLVQVANTPVGSAVRKTISGGERKRVSIGVELITDPSIIMLDEPTSGLDSFKSLQMIKLLRKIARSGKTVISSIHSPNSEGFMLFDKLILLADGYIIYQGEAKLSHEYFCSIGFECPPYSNPADYFMKAFSVQYPLKDNDLLKIEHLKSSYNERMAEAIIKENHDCQLMHPDLNMEEVRISFFGQLKLLINRDMKKITRDSKFFKARYIQNFYVACLMTLIYHNRPDMTIKNNQTSLLGALYFICQNYTIQNCTAALLIFSVERRIFLREYAENLYGAFPYYASKIIIEAPLQMIMALTTTSIVYFGIGLRAEPECFFAFFFTLMNLIFYAASLGYLFGTIFTAPGSSNLVSSQILMPLNILGGFYSNVKLIPVWFSWLQYISPVRYALESLVQNEFGDFSKDDSKVPNPLVYLGYDIGYGQCIACLIGLSITFRIISFFLFKRYSDKNK
ncbi:abc transporter family protein [Stylonychia lemnae]|uniref:Abc transporter family protein n=1 Tax=Stylonychia lemnae TaxID=5949 RepID=A0A078B8R2_STYLE|nr:abc transporter family protein [Stylonychia lemnae]|eukprot:CDW89923.1 abc transporter family protein [Stylonychia lemnae]